MRHIKASREMEERYMLFEELLRNERREGKIKYILELLDDMGTLPEGLREKIETESDVATLNAWHKIAAKAGSIEQFVKEMQ